MSDKKKTKEINSIDMLKVEFNSRVKAAQGSKYSIRSFVKDLGVVDNGIDHSVMVRMFNGQRKLTYNNALKISSGINWSKAKTKEFLAQVAKDLNSGTVTKRSDSSLGRISKKAEAKIQEESESTEAELERDEFIRQANAKIDRAVVKNYNNHGKIIVTTAVEGAEINQGFMKSMETFIAKEKADILFMKTKAHLKPLSEEEYPLDNYIMEHYSDSVYKSVELSAGNAKLSCLDLDIRPYVVDPLSGLAELGAAEGRSFIFAHPQLRFKSYPNPHDAVPRVQWTTQACTDPLYQDNKAGLLGDKNHSVGALIVEIVEGAFYVRSVRADSDGSFIDLGTRYNPDGSVDKNIRAEALTRGDEHIGFHSDLCHAALDDITSCYKPKKIMVHDILEAASVSHHRAHSIKARATVPEHMEFIDTECEGVRNWLKKMNKKKPKDAEIVIVPSNHNEHLHRYLAEGRFIKDCARNMKLGLHLANEWINKGIDPTVAAIDPQEQYGTWLKRSDKPVFVENVVVSNHGDKGANGARGSVKNDSMSFGRSTAGHSHSPEIFHGATRVGTSTILEMDYTIGAPSSWAHACELIFPAKDGMGHRQLLVIIDGKYKMGSADVAKGKQEYIEGAVGGKKKALQTRKQAKLAAKQAIRNRRSRK